MAVFQVRACFQSEIMFYFVPLAR